MGAKGPGLILLIPIIDRMVKVSLRVVAMCVRELLESIYFLANVSVAEPKICSYAVSKPVSDLTY